MIMSLSKDVINLWHRDKHTKIRSIFAQNSLFKDSKFTPDGTKIATLLDDSDIYFWNVSNFEQLKSITHTKSLKLECMDVTSKYLICAGKSPFIMVYDIEHYFIEELISLKIFQLPDGFTKGVTKLQFLRGHLNNCRVAFLTEGIFVLAEITSSESTEEVKIEDQETHSVSNFKILASIKLPHLNILDFDIDRNNYYISIVSSDGLVRIYDVEKLQKSDEKVTQQKVRMSSRDTISYYKYFKEVSYDNMLETIKNVGTYYGTDEGIAFDDSFKLKDITNRLGENTFDRLNLTKNTHMISQNMVGNSIETTKNHEYIEESKIDTSGTQHQLDESEMSNVDEFLKTKGQALINSKHYEVVGSTKDITSYPDVVICKDGYETSYQYTSSASFATKLPVSSKPIILDKTFEPMYEIAKMDFKTSALQFDKLDNILKRYQEYPEKYR